MIAAAEVPVNQVVWPGAVRIIRGVHPPIDVFEDIAEPEDWPLLISATRKTDPRLMETIGNLDLVPPDRRVGGPGSSHLMAPFTHASPDRPSRFSDGRLGVLYVATDFETAVHETAHHHARFMARTEENPGWTSQFRELVLDINAFLHDLRGFGPAVEDLLDPDDYSAPQVFGSMLRGRSSDGIAYPSVRGAGDCVGLFFPDLTGPVIEARPLDYHWDGTRVDLIRNTATGDVFRVL